MIKTGWVLARTFDGRTMYFTGGLQEGGQQPLPAFTHEAQRVYPTPRAAAAVRAEWGLKRCCIQAVRYLAR